MNPIDIDLLKSLETLSSCYNDLITKYRELESKYFDVQINLSLIKSNVNNIVWNLEENNQVEIMDRIDNLIYESLDSKYIKKD